MRGVERNLPQSVLKYEAQVFMCDNINNNRWNSIGNGRAFLESDLCNGKIHFV